MALIWTRDVMNYSKPDFTVRGRLLLRLHLLQLLVIFLFVNSYVRYIVRKYVPPI